MWCDMVWYDMMWCDVIWYDMIRYVFSRNNLWSKTKQMFDVWLLFGSVVCVGCWAWFQSIILHSKRPQLDDFSTKESPQNACWTFFWSILRVRSIFQITSKMLMCTDFCFGQIILLHVLKVDNYSRHPMDSSSYLRGPNRFVGQTRTDCWCNNSCTTCMSQILQIIPSPKLTVRTWKIGFPKRKGSSSNHPCSGAFAVSFREGINNAIDD